MKKIVLGLLAALAFTACADVAASPSTDRTVHVTIRFSKFHPSELHFTAGESVTFVVHNADPIDHEFLIGDEALQTVHENGTEAHHGARPGEISVPAQSTRTTTYEFSAPEPLIAGCHLPGHYAFGMRAPITVSVPPD